MAWRGIALAMLLPGLLLLSSPAVRAEPVANAVEKPGAPLPVLILHSYSQEYPWTKGQHQGFIESLNRDPRRRYDVRAEYLDTKRTVFDDAYANMMAGHLRHKYAGYRPVALYVTDDNALRFAMAHSESVFPGVPVFFSGVNDYRVRDRLDRGRFTGVFERKEIGPNLDLMQQMASAQEEILVLGDASETDRAVEAEVRAELKTRPGIRAHFLSSNSFPDLQARLAASKERFIFLGTLGAVRGLDGNPLTLPEVLGAVVSPNRVVMSMEDVYLLPGVLGGWVTSGPRQGAAAADLLRRHLDGTTLTQLPPIETSPNEYVFDDRELRRIGLELPPEIERQATHLNVRPGFYEANRMLVLGSLYAVIALAFIGMIAALLVYRRKNHQIIATSLRLAESEGRFRSLFDSSPDPIWLISRYEFVDCNRAAVALLGYADKDTLRNVHPARLSPEFQPDGEESHAKAQRMMVLAERTGSNRFDWVHRRADGSDIPVEVTLSAITILGKPIIYCSWRDITESRRAQDDLRRSEERLREAQRIAHIGDWELDLLTERLAWSDEIHRIFEIEKIRFGATYESFLGIIHPEDRDAVDLAYRQSLENRKPYSIRHRLLLPDGRVKFVEERCETMFAEDGRPLRSVGTVQDITDRTVIENELAEYRSHLEGLVDARTAELSIAKEAAEAANRAKSTFLANMSHELRTPLNAIMGLTGLVMRGTMDRRLRGQLEKIDKASRHLLEVINDVLDLSKIEAERFSLNRVGFRMQDVVDKVADLIGPRAVEKGLEFRVDLAPEIGRMVLQGDPVRLSQILLNLTGNAVKFTDSGSVEVGVKILNESLVDVELRFEISDSGIGISATDQARLFSPFEQADSSMTRKYGGTGLGLVISRRLARMMDGDIDLASEPGVGSRFRCSLRLPKAGPLEENVLAATQTAELGIRARHQGKSILVAEDEPVNQEVTRMLLEDTGLNVDVAVDGAVAVKFARMSDYALILMDMQMPVMNGIEATQAIREMPRHAETPIVAMTANAFDEDRAACIAAGMNDHLGKPTEPELLFATVLKWLEQRAG